ncbi:MAG: secretin N-terminal domain-containing protein [Vampirovibrionales bacterium]
MTLIPHRRIMALWACLLLILLPSGVFSPGLLPTAQAAVSLQAAVSVPNGSKKVTLQVSNAPIKDVLRGLATQGGVNLMIDESVAGNITVDLKQIPLNEALASVISLSNLSLIPQSQNLFLVLHRDRADTVGLTRTYTQLIPVQFGNATQMAALLNSTLFANTMGNSSTNSGNGSSMGGGGQSNATNNKVQADHRTNTLIVMGTQKDIELATQAVQSLDRPRESRTFYLSHANAVDVATQLVSSLFNDGTQGILMGAGGGAGGGGGGGSAGGGGAGGGGGGRITGGGGGGTAGPASAPASVRVNTESVEEGSGINNLSGSTSSDSSSSTFSEDIVLRGTVKTSETLQISPLGAIVLPDTRLNTITVMGTAEQIAQAESLIPILDAEPPQVSIDVSLVEISEQGIKDLSTNVGLAGGRFQFGFNNEPLTGIRSQTAVTTPANTGLIGLPTNTGNEIRSGALFSTRPLVTGDDFLLQVNALINNRRAKVLANPTIVATHDTEAIVSIVDQIVRRVNVTIGGLSGTTSIETELGEAGIVLDVLPKIGEDGTVTMRIRPSITSIRDIQEDSSGNLVTLLTKRDLLAQAVRIKDGQTLMMGGLVKETTTLNKNKYPLLGDLPIVGAMFRASSNNQSRSELVLMMTPHIINTLNPTPAITRNPLTAVR